MPKKRPSRRKPAKPSKAMRVLAWLASLFLAGGFVYLMFEAFSLDVFSTIQLSVLGAFLLLLLVVIVWGLFRRRTKTWAKSLLVILSVALGSVSVLGGWYIQQTADFFSIIGTRHTANHSGKDGDDSDSQTNAILDDAAGLGEKMAVTVTTYSTKGYDLKDPASLSGKRIGTVPTLDEEGTKAALAQLESKGMKDAEILEFADQYQLVDALYADNVVAVVLPEQFHSSLLDAANDYNRYGALTTLTNTVDQYLYYEDIPEDMKNEADPVADITQDPFVVMISGSDNYGTLMSKSRTDVNMLAVVNPKTHEVLLVSLPRASYMPFSCRKNETACGYAAGQYDKLTHSGIYGIGTTESTIEDFLNIEINYTVQVNFSSLINVVDAVGGIDITVEPGLEVERFYANGTEGVHEGVNHLDGERALAFARERHAYLDGDNQRIRNQQQVMKALMRSVMSPSMLVNYPKVLTALSTAFTTNMPSSQIRDLIRLEVSSFPSWNIQSYALTGASDTQMSAALGAAASVTLVYEEDVNTAHSLIEDVLEGRVPQIPAESEDSEDSKHVLNQTNQTEPPIDPILPPDYGNENGGVYVDPSQTPSYTYPVQEEPIDPGTTEVPIEPAPADPGTGEGGEGAFNEIPSGDQ